MGASACKVKQKRADGAESIMGRALKIFLNDEQGATAIEYALIATGIAIPLIAVLTSVGSAVQVPFRDVSSGLQGK